MGALDIARDAIPPLEEGANEGGLGMASLEEGDDVQGDRANEVPEWVVNTVMLFCGVSHLWYWNSILNLSVVINEEYFPDNQDRIPSIMTFVFELAAVAILLLLRKVDALSPTFLLSIACCLFAFAIVTPNILMISNGMSRLVLWYTSAGLFGLCLGMSQQGHFGVGANLPGGIKTVFVSSGQGLGGLLSYVLYLLMMKVGKVQPLTAVWIQMALLIVITAVGPLGCWYLRLLPQVENHVQRQRAAIREVLQEHGKPSTWSLIKKGYFPLLNIALTFFCSYLVFPNVGPFKWPRVGGSTQTEIVMGCSQLAQLLGRSAPLITAFVFSINTTFIINMLRIAYPIIFSVAAVCQGVSVFAQYWFQCIMLFTISLSEGWLSSLGLLYAALAGANIYEKAELSTISVTVLTIAITVALGLSVALQLALRI